MSSVLLPGKSVRPQLSRKSVSPVKYTVSSLPASLHCSVTLPGVWPGVSMTVKLSAPTQTTSPSV